MNLTIYHNPACSKSRQTLAILNERGISPTIVEYLKTPPDAETVLDLARKLGASVAEIMRSNEADFAAITAEVSADDDAGMAAGIGAHPKALQRPIVVNEDTGKAVIGRPPENVLELIDS